MRITLSQAFDDCLERIKQGETVKSCLDQYPHAHEQLVPLLHTALSVATVPAVVASEDFKRQSKQRLLTKLITRQQKARPNASPATEWLAILWQALAGAFSGPARVAVPVTLGIILALQCFLLFGGAGLLSRSPAADLASRGTLSILTGAVQLQAPGAATWEEAKSGMTVAEGSRVKTGDGAQALLTFFNGTTVALDPGTDLVVEHLAGTADKQTSAIVLKQWVGKTLSRVTRLTDAASRYEIQTPSATALVRGTVFITEVDASGATREQTIEGLVSVSAQGREVMVAAGQQTSVQPGASPSEPARVSVTPAGSAGQGAGGASTPGGSAAGTAAAGTNGSSVTQSGTGTAAPGNGTPDAGSVSPTGQNGAGATAAGGDPNQTPGAQPESGRVPTSPGNGPQPPATTGYDLRATGTGQDAPLVTSDNKASLRQNQPPIVLQDEWDTRAVLLFMVIILLPTILILVLWRRM